MHRYIKALQGIVVTMLVVFITADASPPTRKNQADVRVFFSAAAVMTVGSATVTRLQDLAAANDEFWVTRAGVGRLQSAVYAGNSGTAAEGTYLYLYQIDSAGGNLVDADVIVPYTLTSQVLLFSTDVIEIPSTGFSEAAGSTAFPARPLPAYSDNLSFFNSSPFGMIGSTGAEGFHSADVTQAELILDADDTGIAWSSTIIGFVSTAAPVVTTCRSRASTIGSSTIACVAPRIQVEFDNRYEDLLTQTYLKSITSQFPANEARFEHAMTRIRTIIEDSASISPGRKTEFLDRNAALQQQFVILKRQSAELAVALQNVGELTTPPTEFQRVTLRRLKAEIPSVARAIENVESAAFANAFAIADPLITSLARITAIASVNSRSLSNANWLLFLLGIIEKALGEVPTLTLQQRVAFTARLHALTEEIRAIAASMTALEREIEPLLEEIFRLSQATDEHVAQLTTLTARLNVLVADLNAASRRASQLDAETLRAQIGVPQSAPANGGFADVILSLTPAAQSTVPYGITGFGSLSFTTVGAASPTVVGQGRAQADTGTTPPAALALIRLTQSNEIISETTIAGGTLLTGGRIYAERSGASQTAIALANPNSRDAAVSYYFTDTNGQDFGGGSLVLPANGHLAGFLSEQPFYAAAVNQRNFADARTFTFSSSAPMAVAAIRTYGNERSEFLMASLPVSNLSGTEPDVLPFFAQGGGWNSRIVLVNPSDQAISGNMDLLGSDGLASSSLGYDIRPRASQIVEISQIANPLQTGWIRIRPRSGRVPTGYVALLFRTEATTVTQLVVKAAPPVAAVRTYLQIKGAFHLQERGSIRNGIVLVNPDAVPVTVRLEFFVSSGTLLRDPVTLTVPGRGQIVQWIHQLPGLDSLPADFEGTVRIASLSGISAAIFRAIHNGRRELRFTDMPLVQDGAPEPSNIIPHFAEGAGFSSQFILLGTSSALSTGELQFFGRNAQPISLPVAAVIRKSSSPTR